MSVEKNILASIIIVLFSISSCTDTEIATRIPVNISSIDIPQEGQINEMINLNVTSQANNGCYEDLKVLLEQKDSIHFLLTATGLYHTNEVCAQQIITKDTSIIFQPSRVGKYYFQINEYPFPVKRDTLEVK